MSTVRITKKNAISLIAVSNPGIGLKNAIAKLPTADRSTAISNGCHLYARGKYKDLSYSISGFLQDGSDVKTTLEYIGITTQKE